MGVYTTEIICIKNRRQTAIESERVMKKNLVLVAKKSDSDHK